MTKSRILIISLFFFLLLVIYFIIHSQKLTTDSQSIANNRNELLIDQTQYTFYIENENNAHALTPSTFVVSAESSGTGALPDEIVVSLDMLSMNCGTVQFTLNKNNNEQYVGEGIPVMKGTWVASASIPSKQEDHDAQILSFMFHVQ